MSLSRETMMELMSLADGELEGEAKERAERLVEQSEEARRVVEAVRAPEISLWLVESTNRGARAADGIADAVMARIEAAPVARMSDTRTAKKVSRAHVAAAAAFAAMALAAAIALTLRTEGSKSGAEREPARTDQPSVDVEPAPPPPSLAQQSVEVDEIDSPSRGVSVYEIGAGGGASAKASSIVIWIEDEKK